MRLLHAMLQGGWATLPVNCIDGYEGGQNVDSAHNEDAQQPCSLCHAQCDEDLRCCIHNNNNPASGPGPIVFLRLQGQMANA